MIEISVIEDITLSKSNDKRYVIIDKGTGKVIDDAQGYGYKSVKKAYAAYTYKHRDKSKDEEKAERKKHIIQWMREHKEFVGLMRAYSFDIVKGSGNPNDKFNAAFVNQMLREHNLQVDFTAGELLKVFLKEF